MNIAGCYIWGDRERGSIGVRSVHRKSDRHPFEFYTTKHLNGPAFRLYQTQHDTPTAELRLSLKLLWFSANLLLWVYKDKQIDDMDSEAVNKPKSWGFDFDGFGISKNLTLNWGKRTKYWDLPFFSWVFVRSELLRFRNQTVVCRTDNTGGELSHFTKMEGVKKENSVTLPYRYENMDGEVQEVQATVHVEQWLRRRKWTPFVWTQKCIDVRFSDGVGSERGSWKGGCTGCSYELKKNENPIQCLRRMERERRFDR